MALALAAPQYEVNAPPHYVADAPAHYVADTPAQYEASAPAHYGGDSVISAEQWAALNPYGSASYYPADEKAS